MTIEWWQILIIIFSIPVATFMIRMVIKFDINRYQETKKKKQRIKITVVMYTHA